MKARPIYYLLLTCLLAGLGSVQAQGASFTYQGQLFAGGSSANGNYDLCFGLYSSSTGSSPVANLITNTPVPVTNGLFTVTLDFGNVFNGTAYWLEIGVRTNGSTSNFTTLAPRQLITGTPYSQYSLASGSVSGVLSVANLPTNVALLNGNANFSGTVTAGNFTGNASGLTNLNATNLNGADNYAWFGLGLVPRVYSPPNNNVQGNWGVSPVFSVDGLHWEGAIGFPAVFNTNYVLRDASLYKVGNTIFAAMTTGTGNVSASCVQIYSSTNGGGMWQFVTSAYFTNSTLGLENPSNTWAPEFFTWQGSPYLIASCFFPDSTPHAFRIIQCTDTKGFTTWSTATNVNMTGILTGADNDPFLYDDAANSGNWYLWTANTALLLYKGSSPMGPWTNVSNFSFNGSLCEGPCMFHLPNGKYRLYTDQYHLGYEAFSESSTIESGWSSLTNITCQAYFGHFTPIILTNIQDVQAAHDAASSTIGPNWDWVIQSPTWGTPSSEPKLRFGPWSYISGASPDLSIGYEWGTGMNFNVSNVQHILQLGENGYVTAGGNGFSGNASGLTNFNVANLAGITNLAAGLTFQAGAGALAGRSVVPLSLTAGSQYLYNFTNVNDLGIYDSSFTTVYPTSGPVVGFNAFTVPTSGTYFYVGSGQTAGTPAFFELYGSNYIVLPGNIAVDGLASVANASGTSTSGSISITSSGFTNSLGVNVQGYFSITNSSHWTNYNNSGTAWSTNAGPGTNLWFMLQPGGKVRAPANSIDISSVHWTAF